MIFDLGRGLYLGSGVAGADRACMLCWSYAGYALHIVLE